MNDDDRIDAQLRQWGEQQRQLAARPVALRTTPPSRRRAGLLAAAAAVAVLLIAGGALALRDSTGTPSAKSAAPSTGAPEPTSQAPTSSPHQPPPPGTQQVTFRSLAVTVPASWKIDDEFCGRPQSDTVLIPEGATAGCLTGSPPGITWVEFAATGQYLRPVEQPHTRRISVDGHPATETTGRMQGNAAVVVDVPAADARAAVYSPSLQHAQRIAMTLAVVDVDSRGCATRAPYEPLPATPPPSRAGARNSLIPGTPISMTVCGYDAEGLGGSGQVPASDLSTDLAKLRGLPSGYSIVPRRYSSPECTDPAHPARSLDRREADWFAVLVHYAHGPTLVLHARIGQCGYLGITNGAVAAQRGKFVLAEVLIRPSHVSPAFPEHVVPVPQ